MSKHDLQDLNPHLAQGLDEALLNETLLDETLSEFYLKDEAVMVQDLLNIASINKAQSQSTPQLASEFVHKIRAGTGPAPLIDAFLQEYGLSTEEGIILMRLAESLIRTPDKANAYALIRDKIEAGDWSSHKGEGPTKLIELATASLGMTKNWIKLSGGIRAKNLAAQLGDRALYMAIFRVMQMMGDHYVLGKNINSAIKTALRQSGPLDGYSFDMLGEAAHTYADAERYFQAYKSALQAIANAQIHNGFSQGQAGLSVKLSALHPRYEYVQKHKCVPELVTKLAELCLIARDHGLNLTIDAEEADRLEVSLLVLHKLANMDSLKHWNGLGFVVQAYQRRAIPLIRHLIELYKDRPNHLNIRLVKGAYWDSEIKRAQEMGLESYPVFTRKENTDLSYLACAKVLFEAPGSIFPRFATHNAHTAAAIITMAGPSRHYEFQRLHGMGKELHDILKSTANIASRVYAPVGKHEDLLPYLVRRLLENGANSSFVNQLTSDDIAIADIIADPLKKVTDNKEAAHPNIYAPRNHLSDHLRNHLSDHLGDHNNSERWAARGLDHTQAAKEPYLAHLIRDYRPIHAHSLIGGKAPKAIAQYPLSAPFDSSQIIGTWEATNTESIDAAIALAKTSKWQNFSAEKRREILINVGELLDQHYDHFLALCINEAGKTWIDAIAEIREAIDFCYYYAGQITKPAPDRQELGIVACISPWNFPLAIFLGQIIGSLAAGNSVICKPAQQTPLIAFEAIKLLHQAGIPETALHLILGDGAELGNYISGHSEINGICFTGSTSTAQKIAGQLVATGRADIPFIAETGGINAMIVDSTALLEQVVSDVIASAFQSAGQRCSACRVVCIQDEVAEDFMTMLGGAMQALTLSLPAKLSTDIGPVIDKTAHRHLEDYITASKAAYRTIYEIPSNQNTQNGFFIRPIAFEIPNIKVLKQEIFGPVLHVLRFKEKDLNALIQDINALGYGLTMGLHTRIDDRVTQISNMARVGNLYINRNQIGAVVGVQPFGGEGLSGTGPKAGGPYYVKRLSKAKTTAQAKCAALKDSDLKNNDTVLDLSKPDTSFAFDIMKTASQDWFNDISHDKITQIIDIIQDICGPFDMNFLSQLHWPDSLETQLPGPTGERNHLKLWPRGIILCGPEGNINSLAKQLLKTLITGNAALIYGNKNLDTAAQNTLLSQLENITKQRHLIQFTDIIPFGPKTIHHLGGVITRADHVNRWAAWALSMRGPLLPILTAHDDIERFFIERTISINTTAAGGNATLLAL